MNNRSTIPIRWLIAVAVVLLGTDRGLESIGVHWFAAWLVAVSAATGVLLLFAWKRGRI